MPEVRLDERELEVSWKVEDKTDTQEVTGVQIRATQDGIEIAFDGYGTADLERGPVIYIERYQGRPKLYAWADNKSKDPTHVIDFGAAKEAA